MLKSVVTILMLTAPSVAFAASDWVRCVQNQLNDLGYQAGSADGLLGQKTIAAGDRYIAFMKSQHAGWNMASLNQSNPDHWCKQVANANPKVAQYFTNILAAQGSSIMTVKNVEVGRDQKAGVPYPVEITFELVGQTPTNIDAACFMWNAEGPYCFAPQSLKGQTISVTLQTGNPNTYQLNAALQYSSGGKQQMSNWFTSTVDVKP